jgi:hypothetical protein
MAKATPQAYRVVGSPLSYNGKTAKPDEVLTDIPGQSIAWLLEGGHIVAEASPKKAVADAESALEVEPQPDPEPALEAEPEAAEGEEA